MRTAITARNKTTIAAAEYGWAVANQVNPIAKASSPKLKAAFENGSGDGVTTARNAVLLLWAARAMAPPIMVASNCFSGES